MIPEFGKGYGGSGHYNVLWSNFMVRIMNHSRSRINPIMVAVALVRRIFCDSKRLHPKEKTLIEDQLSKLCDLASEALNFIQRDFKHLNPVIGVNRNMRDRGIPADAVTIDCLKSGKRIIIILHDHQPTMVNYQFSFKEQDPKDEFLEIHVIELTAQRLYEWMKNYFSS